MSSFPSEELPEIEAGSPLLLATPKPARRSKRKRALVIGGGLLALVLIAVVVWLFMIPRAATAPAKFVLTPDPDPPVVAPAAKDLVKPPADELAGVPSLESRLARLLKEAASIDDSDELARGNSRADRWDIRFPSGNTLEAYASQLDALGIELGVVGGGDKITYASKFQKPKPDRREGMAAAEQRVYMTWKSGPLRDADAALLARAEVQSTDKVVAQFYPSHVEKVLADLEIQFADKHDLAEVKRTVFKLKPVGEGYTFAVAEQEYFSGEIKIATDKPKKDDKKPAAEPKPAPPAKADDKPAPVDGRLPARPM